MSTFVNKFRHFIQEIFSIKKFDKPQCIMDNGQWIMHN